MSFWSRITGGFGGGDGRGSGGDRGGRAASGNKSGSKSHQVDYLSEALALERQGDFDAALTSYRLALRDQPNNFRVLQNMAIAYSKIGRQTEAISCYKRALEIEPKLPGAHYGLAFLLLKRGDVSNCAYHLEAFLMDPPATPSGPETERWIKHARETLDNLYSPKSEQPNEITDQDPPEASN